LTGQNTVSAVVTRLEERRLVTRGRSSDDGRIVTVTLTAVGRRLLQRAPEPPTVRLLGALSSLPPAELRTVVRALTILNKRLGLRPGESGMLFEEDGPPPRARRRNGSGTARRKAS
jgi:DNA-binding MarR family transcriptional regulator